jgi:tRNA threonylcarbamoyladenosine biosynthesis protein TsaB
MLIFALDTSTPAGSSALLRDAAVLAQSVTTPDEPYSPNLLRQAISLLDSECISLEQIDLFAVCAGPGSFTGLRIGLTTVKGWAEIWKKPVAAVSALEAVATQVLPSSPQDSLLGAVLDARRGQIFAGLFRARGESSGPLDAIGEEVLANPDEFVKSVRLQVAEISSLILACVSPELIRPAVERQGLRCRIEVVSNVLAPIIGQLGYAKAIRGNVVDALHLDANYIRRSDAEVNWKGI